MELTSLSTMGETYKAASGEFTIPAGQWVWVYKGPIMNPTTELETQVPTGKTWKVRISVEVTESSA